MQQQRQPQNAALRDAGERMYVVQAEGENGAAQQGEQAGSQGNAQDNKSFHKYIEDMIMERRKLGYIMKLLLKLWIN